MIRDGREKFAQLLSLTNISGNPGVHFEYEVKPLRGRGKASCTDLLVRSSDRALAIEAKWTEGRYTAVEQWLREGNDPANRLEVLRGWLELLGKRAAHELTPRQFNDCVYQLLHRAASACAEGNQPSVAYPRFHEPSTPASKESTCLNDLDQLHRALGRPKDLPFHYFELELRPTKAFELIKALRHGAPSTAVAVRRALVGPPLFEFGELRHQRVGA